MATPVLNLDELGRPLTFRSALAGPHKAQWRKGNGDELVKLVETTRTLTPVHFATSRAEGRRGTAPAVLEQVSTPGFWLERALGAVLRARSHLQRRLLLLQGRGRGACD